MDLERPELEQTPNIAPEELSAALRAKLLAQQDPVYAVIGGMSAAIVGGVLWAMVTVLSKYQIGYMAIGVGLLCGFAVRFFGAGIQLYFGFIGAFFALAGCALGNLLSQVVFIADAQSLGYFETITLLNFDIITQIFMDAFTPMDVLFYGIAGYEGYKFAFRRISDELTDEMSAGLIASPPHAKLRLPIVIVLFLILSIGGYLIRAGSTGVKTFYYESGSRRTMGELVHGRENGPWEGWWENGNQQWQGTYIEGSPDNTWNYYDEDGVLYRTGTFAVGIQHGQWTDYYPNGNVQATGKYEQGRKHGPWSYMYESGGPLSTGAFLLDLPEGLWETFYENGKLSSKGSYSKGVQAGLWTYWSEDGNKSMELEFADGKSKILNTWSAKGAAEIVNGNGTYKSSFPGGQLMESGDVKDGVKVGLWKKNYENGSRQEEGTFRNGTYYLANSWSTDGKPVVINGEGIYQSHYPDGSLFETGTINKGLKAGKWITYAANSDSLLAQSNYTEGKLEGAYSGFSEQGTLLIEGMFHNDKQVGEWNWYTQEGALESTVSFVEGKKDGTQLFFDESGNVLRIEVYNNGELVESRIGPE